MSKVKVFVGRHFFQKDLDYLKNGTDERVEFIIPQEYDRQTIEGMVQGAEIDVWLGETPPEYVFDAVAKLGIIQIPWTGVDRINFDLLSRKNVTVCNSHGNALVVAEYVVALLMSLLKGIPLHDRELRKGNWKRPVEGVPGSHVPPDMLGGKTVVLLGYGAIGRKIDRLLSGFDLKVIGIDAARTIEPENERTVVLSPEETEAVAGTADVMIVSLPLTPTTRGMVDAEFFGKLKNDSFFVNASRGEIVEEKALYDALVSHQIAGAAIDVWYQYPQKGKKTILPSKHYRFEELDNLVMSPHRAGFSKNSLPHLDDVIENLNRMCAGMPPMNVVNLEDQY